MAKTGTYTDQNGNQKSRWIQVGRMLSNQNGDFIVLDGHISLAGLQQIQNQNQNQGAQSRDGVLVSIFEDQPKQQGQQQQPPRQQNQSRY